MPLSRSRDVSVAVSPVAGSEPPPMVCVRFAASQGGRLTRPEPTTCGDGAPLWAERPTLLRRADGTYVLMGASHNLDGLARWLLSFGADATVGAPDALRRRVRALARRVRRQYRDDG